MGDADHQRFLGWLSRLDEAEPVVLPKDNQPITRFTFEGNPTAKQTSDATLPNVLPSRSSRAGHQRTLLELNNCEQSHLQSWPTKKETDTRISRKEKNEYKRFPRAKTKEDRYEYKGRSSRVDSDRGTTAKNKKSSRQKRKHTINEDFRASNVPSNRLTLHPPANLGIFNRGKRSSPVKTRVLDHGFSETKFLSHGQLYTPGNGESRHGPKSIFHYDFGIGDVNAHHKEADFEQISPSVATIHQPQALSRNIELKISGTSICHEGENHAALIGDSTTAPFSHPVRGHKAHAPLQRPICCSPSNQSIHSVTHEPTTQLLDFDLNSPNDRLGSNTIKKLWTLEDLKRIMQRRVAAWSAKDDASIATSSRFQQESRKRKRSPSQELQEHPAEVPKEAETHGIRHVIDTRPFNKSTTPRTAILDSSYTLGDFVDQPLGQPTSMSEHPDRFGESSILDSQLHCRERDPPRYYEDNTYLTPQALDAAYEAIMRSELDASSHLREHRPILDGSVGNNEDYVDFLLATPLEWGFEGGENLEPFQFAQRIIHSHKEGWPCYTTSTGRHHPQPSFPTDSFGNRAPPLSTEPNSAWELQMTPSQNNSASNTFALDVDPMKNFWQQNTLY
ncbi:hypothetical protein BDW69DRAFT_188693 [Aspergillus filifer]